MIARRHKSGFSRSPRKGTTSRKILLLCLTGYTVEEMSHACRCPIRTVTKTIDRLRDDCGWDIRRFPRSGRTLNDRRVSVFKVVGKMKWDGSYRSFIERQVEAA